MKTSLFQNVLVLINGSEASIEAVRYGVVLAKYSKCNLRALYVVDTATLKQLTLNKFFVEEESLDFEKSLRNDGVKYLKYAEEIAKAKGIKIETEIRSGSVWGETIAVASEMKSDLILVSGLEQKQDKIHAVATMSYHELMKHAHCSVLMVRNENIEKLYENI
ncbi:MAG TPA: universal stress protein [Treponemataceae bacterium]|nr:universal stress protein [Treponemataceae bacterium]